VDQLLVDRPGWLDWPWALRVLAQERQDEELRSRLGLGWSQIRAAARHAVPYRSILGDTLLELLSD
jgi:hypothetical protein